MNVMDVCAGTGAASLGIGKAVGRSHRSVCYIERDARNAALLVARMEDEALDRAPIWDDLCTFDGAAWRGCVDLIAAGLPCQPYSGAGKGGADADERALWPSFGRLVRDVEPALVFLENVPGFLKHSEGIFHAMEELGFIWAPPLRQAASWAGAPSIRERVYLMCAHADRFPVWLRSEWESGGLTGLLSRAPSPFFGNAGQRHADADRRRREGQWRGWTLDHERETLRHDTDRCSGGCVHCGTYWEAESPVLRVADGPADRVDQLRAIGNIGAPPVVYADVFASLFNGMVEVFNGQA